MQFKRVSHAITKALGGQFFTSGVSNSSAGVVVSDSSIQWIALESQEGHVRVRAFGEKEMPGGVIVNGRIENAPMFAQALADLKRSVGAVEHFHVSVPLRDAYIFSMQVPANFSREQIFPILDYELKRRVPTHSSALAYDFKGIAREGEREEVGVVAFPREVSESYKTAFEGNGVSVRSVETGAQSIARAIWSEYGKERTVLVLDLQEPVATLIVIKRGVPICSSYIATGDANQSVLDEIERHHRYWDRRRDAKGRRVTPIEKIVLIGSGASEELSEKIAARMRVESVLPNVWRQLFSFEEHIPSMNHETSLRFATPIGLALKGF